MNAKYYTISDMRKSYEQGKKQGIRLSIENIMAVITIKLQDKHGFTADQLHQLEAEVNGEFDEVLEDRITLDEILEARREEMEDV